MVDYRLVYCSPRKGSRPVADEEVGKAVDGDSGPLVLEDQPARERIVEFAAEHGIEIAVPMAQCSRA